MVTVDYYSSFFEVDFLSTKTADEVIRKLKAHLARHGIPDQFVSDNGQPFVSDKFCEFTNAYGFDHVTSSPLRQPNHSWIKQSSPKEIRIWRSWIGEILRQRI